MAKGSSICMAPAIITHFRIHRWLTYTPGVLRTACQTLRWLPQSHGMGSRRPWEDWSTMILFISTFLTRPKSVPLCDPQTPWEGGVYKLMMLFPEGPSLSLHPISAAQHNAHTSVRPRISIQATEMCARHTYSTLGTRLPAHLP